VAVLPVVDAVGITDPKLVGISDPLAVTTLCLSPTSASLPACLQMSMSKRANCLWMVSVTFCGLSPLLSHYTFSVPTKKARKRVAPTQGPSVGEGSSGKAKKRKR
jgi:hypothetical protein